MLLRFCFVAHAAEQAHGCAVRPGAVAHALRCCFFMVAPLLCATAFGRGDFDFFRLMRHE
jgi:hypothetical protein